MGPIPVLRLNSKETMKTTTKASIASILIFAAICSVLAYIQRKGKTAHNVIQFPEFINGEECHFC
jgi:hypothetical protein